MGTSEEGAWAGKTKPAESLGLAGRPGPSRGERGDLDVASAGDADEHAGPRRGKGETR